MAIQMPKGLRNLNVFVDGESYAGRILSLKPPNIALNVEPYSNALITPIPLVTGVSGVLKASFVLAEFSKEIQNKVGKDNTTLIAKGALSDDESINSDAVLVVMKGIISNYSPSIWEARKGTKDKYTISLSYFKFSGHSGNLELDTENNKYVVDGEDIVETIRNKINI